jgi:hypothetical protein
MTLSELFCEGMRPQTGCQQPKGPGNLVMIGPNRGPVFEIVYVAHGLAWVRPLANGQEGLVALDRLRTVDQDRVLH